jgi:hypothetical protein
MRELNEFKNKHINEDIYVLCSGKGVDFIDESFFSNKIIIGINQVYKKVKCNYLLRKENNLLKEVIEKNTNTIHFISKGKDGSDNVKNLIDVNNNFAHNNNIIVFNHNANKKLLPDIIKDNELLVSWSTVTSGIHLAAYMGAKNIILVGHDGGLINGECNFKGYHTDETYKIAWPKNGKADYIIWLQNIEKDTIKLKKMLNEKYKCNILSINPFINFNLEGNKYSKN